ncbi:hypothetical protein [Pseudomonas sp.]|uniref:hypothetical protein n=1 Tax=Pseudomonas sp. TaxID=306 RepID=UPI00258E422F|nr:hypothetical protein [Pseudomonas sp.]
MTESTELALVPPKETALQVFQAANGLDPYLQQIRAEIDNFTPDLSTKKGRAAIASIANKVARSKTALDTVGKELVADLKEIPKKVDAERKRMRDLLDAWKDEVRRPLTEWEAAEAARVAGHKETLDWLAGFIDQRADLTAEQLQFQLTEVEAFEISAALDEFEADAARGKDQAVTALRDQLSRRIAHEEQLAEIARFNAEKAEREQKEREERIARESAERATREAEQRAQAERDAAIKREAEAKAAAERRELEMKLQAERADREKLEAQQRAEQAERNAAAQAERAAAAERQRIADEQAAAERAAKAREADKAHRGEVNRTALAAFIAGGMPEACAKQAVTLIAQGKIPGVSIFY